MGLTGDLGPECRELKAGLTSKAWGAGSVEASLPPRCNRSALTQAGPSPPPHAALLSCQGLPSFLSVTQPPGLDTVICVDFFLFCPLNLVIVIKMTAAGSAVITATVYAETSLCPDTPSVFVRYFTEYTIS